MHRESNHCTFNVGKLLAFGAEVFILIFDGFSLFPEIDCRHTGNHVDSLGGNVFTFDEGLEIKIIISEPTHGFRVDAHNVRDDGIGIFFLCRDFRTNRSLIGILGFVVEKISNHAASSDFIEIHILTGIFAFPLCNSECNLQNMLGIKHLFAGRTETFFIDFGFLKPEGFGHTENLQHDLGNVLRGASIVFHA